MSGTLFEPITNKINLKYRLRRMTHWIDLVTYGNGPSSRITRVLISLLCEVVAQRTATPLMVTTALGPVGSGS